MLSLRSKPPSRGETASNVHRGFSVLGFPNLMDATLFRSLAVSFVVCFVALAAIFNIFTLFELWRFIAVTQAGAGLVARYLLFLLPLITVELFPATMLISVLVTYALLARRHEAIAWWASGQSVYRLMLPGFFFALTIAFGSWLVQEHVMPGTNLKQDALRARIRGGEARAMTPTGRQWLASTETRRFYSYEFAEDGRLIEPTVYELDSDAVHLAQVVSGKRGAWTDATHLKITDAETLVLNDLEVQRKVDAEIIFAGVESPAVFKPTIDKPSQLSAQDLKNYLNAARKRGMDVSTLAVALQKKIRRTIRDHHHGIDWNAARRFVWKEGNCDRALRGGGCRYCLLGGRRRLSATGELRVATAVSRRMDTPRDLRGSRDLFPVPSPNLATQARQDFRIFKIYKIPVNLENPEILYNYFLGPLRPGFPARNVLKLLWRQRIDRDSECAQLKARDFGIDFSRQ